VYHRQLGTALRLVKIKVSRHGGRSLRWSLQPWLPDRSSPSTTCLGGKWARNDLSHRVGELTTQRPSRTRRFHCREPRARERRFLLRRRVSGPTGSCWQASPNQLCLGMMQSFWTPERVKELHRHTAASLRTGRPSTPGWLACLLANGFRHTDERN
jgi:hypothetical protein